MRHIPAIMIKDIAWLHLSYKIAGMIIVELVRNIKTTPKLFGVVGLSDWQQTISF